MFKLIILFIFFITSCSTTNPQYLSILKKANSKTHYILKDKSGTFNITREIGYRKKTNELILKRKLTSSEKGDKFILEKNIAISTPGILNKKTTILRPKISQYSVWFEKQKYFTEIKIDVLNKSLNVKMVSPEKQWSGEKLVKFPKGTGVYCFFSQLVECIQSTNFINLAIQRENGSMSLHIIWDGYPYFQEQYLNVPNELFTPAKFTYDGLNKSSEKRFSLNIGNQIIFYLFNNKREFVKMYWVAQEFSMEKKDLKN